MKYFKHLALILLPIALKAQIRTVENNTQSIILTPESITVKKGTNGEPDQNVSLGMDALKSNQINSQVGVGNVAIGTETLKSNTLNLNGTLPWGIFNTAVGYNSMVYNRGGNWNTAIGTYSLSAAQNPRFNTAIGYNAAHHLGSRENVAIGADALLGGYYGNRNTAIGNKAGEHFGSIANEQDSANVFIGYQAGSSSISKTNKLFIANNNTQSPLIWGDFYQKNLAFHGKVGIGTKSPVDLLSIHDSTSSIPNSYLRFTNGFSGLGINDGFRIGLTEFMSGIIWHYEDKPLVFGTNNTSRMTIHENGRVGIGTQNPQGNLHIYQNAGSSNLILNTSFSGSGVFDGLTLNSSQFSSSIINRENSILFLGTNNTNIATLHPDGKFGIGLLGLPASSDLHIHKQDFADSELRLTNISSGNTVNDGFSIAMKNGGELEMNYRENQKVVFQTNTSTTPELVLQTNGNLGLGVTNATTKLEVNGFTKLGTDAPAIKIKKLTIQTANTDAEPNNITYVPHGLNGAKILGVQVLVEYAPNQFVPHAFTNNPSYEFHFLVNNTNDIELKVKPGNSSSILNKTARILITYEE